MRPDKRQNTVSDWSCYSQFVCPNQANTLRRRVAPTSKFQLPAQRDLTPTLLVSASDISQSLRQASPLLPSSIEPLGWARFLPVSCACCVPASRQETRVDKHRLGISSPQFRRHFALCRGHGCRHARVVSDAFHNRLSWYVTRPNRAQHAVSNAAIIAPGASGPPLVLAVHIPPRDPRHTHARAPPAAVLPPCLLNPSISSQHFVSPSQKPKPKPKSPFVSEYVRDPVSVPLHLTYSDVQPIRTSMTAAATLPGTCCTQAF